MKKNGKFFSEEGEEDLPRPEAGAEKDGTPQYRRREVINAAQRHVRELSGKWGAAGVART